MARKDLEKCKCIFFQYFEGGYGDGTLLLCDLLIRFFHQQRFLMSWVRYTLLLLNHMCNLCAYFTNSPWLWSQRVLGCKDSNVNKNTAGILMRVRGGNDIRRMSWTGKWDWERWTCVLLNSYLLVGVLNISWNNHCKQDGWMILMGGRSRQHLGRGSRSMVKKTS